MLSALVAILALDVLGGLVRLLRNVVLSALRMLGAHGMVLVALGVLWCLRRVFVVLVEIGARGVPNMPCVCAWCF